MQKRKWPRTLFVSVTVLLGICLLALWLLPIIVQRASVEHLIANQLEKSSISNIDFNVITGKFRLHQLAAGHSDTYRGLAVDEIDVDFSLRTIIHNTLYLNQIAVTGLSIKAVFDEDGTISVGYEPELQTGIEEVEELLPEDIDSKPGEPWIIQVQDLRMINNSIVLFNHDTSANVEVKFDIVLHDLQVDTLGNVSFDHFALNNYRVLLKGKQVLAWQSLTINDLQLENQQLNISSLDVQDFGAVVNRLANGQPQLVEMLNKFVNAEQAVPEHIADTSTPVVSSDQTDIDSDAVELSAFKWRIGAINIAGNSSIELNDASLTPALDKVLRIQEISIGAIDSIQPDVFTDIKVDLASDEHDEIFLVGQLKPLLGNPQAKLEFKIDQFDLTDFSPYVASALGYDIKTGVLNLETTADISEGRLISTNKLFLNRIRLSLSNAEKAEAFNSSIQLPLDTALNIISDEDGNIHLDIPVDGALDDPDFRLGPTVRGAMASSISAASLTYVQYAIQPWGAALFLGNVIGGAIGKVRFEPLIFEVGSSKLVEDMPGYLAKVSELLKNKKQLQITACPVTNSVDKENLKQLGGKSLTEDALQAQLDALAESRFSVVKDILVNQYEIDSSRIINCLASHSTESAAQPMVELSL